MSDTYRSPFEDRRTMPPEMGEQLALWRERAELSLRGLGRRTGVDFSYLSKIEAGKRCPSAAVAQALARALGLSEEETKLLEGSAVPDHGRSYPKHPTAA